MKIRQFKQNYAFDDSDVKNLLELKETIGKEAEVFAERFVARILTIPVAQIHLETLELQNTYKRKVEQWYKALFCGVYDDNYFDILERVADMHVKIELPIHQVTSAINFARKQVIRSIYDNYKESHRVVDLIASSEKIIDMNLDVLVSAYHEGEMMAYSTFSKFKLSLVALAKKASDLADLTLVVALMLVGPFVVWLFLYDVYLLITGKVAMEEGILMVLGSLLVLWAVTELMEEQIKHLRGEGFAIAVFISLAMAALIRKILVASLSNENMYELLSYGGLVLALGIVYWLVVKNDIRIESRKK